MTKLAYLANPAYLEEDKIKAGPDISDEDQANNLDIAVDRLQKLVVLLK